MAAVAAADGSAPVEAEVSYVYANVVMTVTEYERTAYTDFDLVQMRVTIENFAGVSIPGYFAIGGVHSGADAGSTISYGDVSYADVRGRGGDVSVQDCTSDDRFEGIASGSVGEAVLCFMVDSDFQPPM